MIQAIWESDEQYEARLAQSEAIREKWDAMREAASTRLAEILNGQGENIMSAQKIIAMHHAQAAREDNSAVDELDALALQLEQIIGKQACWEFATGLRERDREKRKDAYREKIAALTAPALTAWIVEYYTAGITERQSVVVMAADRTAASDIVWGDKDKYHAVMMFAAYPGEPVDADPCSMEWLETPQPSDPDAADREAETSHARQGF